MKIIVLCLLLGSTLGAPEKDLSIKEFEEKFHQKFASPKDEADAAENLAKNEAEIDEQNEEYAKGEANFEEELEPWDDLSDEEILKEKTGLAPEGGLINWGRSNPMRFRTGLLVKPEHERVNTPEEKAFLDEIYAKYDRDDLPQAWDSRAKGWVTAARNQKQCGSCSAFAQVGMAETSLIKAGAKKEGMDLSEDWLINCRQDGQKDVCKGAHITIYADYMIGTEKLIHENTSPYITQYGSDLGPCLTKPYWSPGYKFEKTVAQWKPTDEQIMMQIMEYGSTVIGIYASKPVFSYKEGVIDTCSNSQINHAVVAVGWGSAKRADGVWISCTSGADCIPYWIIKNSWGKWGEDSSGFGKLKRGTCGINSYGAVTLKAVKTTGVAEAVPEDPTICKNKKPHKKCVQWKNKGYCSGKYEAYMSKNCKASCEVCTPKGGFCDVTHLFGKITGEWNLDMTGSDGTFRDADGLCDAGTCYVVGVANSCKAICGEDPCPECKDKKDKSNCKYWKSLGYCAQNYNRFENNPYLKFMARNCAETCGFCPKK